jgi:DNA-binding transcriptional MerR regulator
MRASRESVVEQPRKIYYSITEVAGMAEVKPHVLRYWETEFSSLRPKKNRAGNRTYREKDVKLVLLIRKLLYDDGFTIKGARKKLQDRRGGDLPQIEIPFTGAAPAPAATTRAAPAPKEPVTAAPKSAPSFPIRELRQELESILGELSS